MPSPRTTPGTTPATDGEALRSTLFGIHWPLLFQAAEQPPTAVPIPYDSETTPARFTWRVMTAAKKFTVTAALLLGASQLAGALLPVATGNAIDSGIAARSFGTLLGWCAVVIAAVLVSSLATRVGTRCAGYGMQTVQHRLRMTVTARLLDPAGMVDRQLGGAHLSIATSDVFRVAGTMQLGVQPVAELVAVVVGGVILVSVAWQLGLAVLLAAPLMLWIMAKAGHPMQRRSAAQQAKVAAATGQAADLITGYRTIKGLRAEDISTTRYRGVTQFMMGPLTNLPRSIGAVWAQGVASAGRVLDLLNTPYTDDRANTAEAPVTVSGIEVHDETGASVLSAAPGELLGVRAEGAPARDLVARIGRGVDQVMLTTGHSTGLPTSGVPATALDIDTWRAVVLTSPRTADLFDGTVADNLDPGGVLPDSAVDQALHTAACTDIIAALPDGTATRVGESGTRLSGGQRQRIALARALAAAPPVLVLHDPTTAVDAITGHTIATRLPAMRAGATTVVVTGSEPLLAACDRIVDLADSVESTDITDGEPA